MKKNCKNCSQQFEITENDNKFYKRMEVIEPKYCPRCRQQRRLATRNELSLYQRTCDFTRKPIISMYSPDKPYKVYDQAVWWSDDWDPMEYGREFDFDRPFFEQFEDLQKVVPRMSLNCIGNENSEYTNYALRNKNSYMVFTSDFNEDTLYSRFCLHNFKCSDCDFTNKSTYCYDSIDMESCTKCLFSQQCDNCSEVYFSYNMKNSHNCVFCTNLINQRNCIFNEQVSQEEFEKFKKKLNLESPEGIKRAVEKAKEFIEKQPRKYLEMAQCEESVGDYLRNSKNAKECYDCRNLHDVKYCSRLIGAKDCYDWDFVAGDSELCYEMCSSAYQLQNCKFSMHCWEGNYDLNYCDLCLGNKHLFGCVGLRKKKYCILNKQYTKEEYDKLISQIIIHMRRTSEWGEFFPVKMSPFGYNESVANEYFPLSHKEAIKRGYKWKDEEEKIYEKTQGDILVCSGCTKNYKLVSQEEKFYKEVGVVAPDKCFNCRHKTRMAKRNSGILHDRQCSKCAATIQSTYSADRPEPVYCEKCYLEVIF